MQEKEEKDSRPRVMMAFSREADQRRTKETDLTVHRYYGLKARFFYT